MGIFKLYECDLSVTIKGISYTFTHVQSFAVEDNERTRLTRGANAGNKVGISYTEGIKEAKTLTATVIGMELAVFDLLVAAFNSKERLKVSAVSRVDGSYKEGKNAVLTQSPKQLTLDDSPESMDTALIFESFDVVEKHKS